MRKLIALLFAFYSCSCQAQNEEVKRIDLKLDIAEFEKKGAHLGKARFLTIDDDFVIGQIGIVDVSLFDLKSGNMVKCINADVIIDSLETHIHRILGEQYYVPDNQENLKSKFVGVIPYNFHGLFYIKEKGKFVVHMVTTVFNRKNDLDQQLFLSLVAFDKNLENIEIIPIDPLNMSTNSGWINGGFFLGEDRLFTKSHHIF